mmetsp:Transcript_7886/g.18199  ORF Transcript_7886/g.18199 Transcript_7886/m.18199 type:complete len:221 (-) Transcript_7886:48-710(-)
MYDAYEDLKRKLGPQALIPEPRGAASASSCALPESDFPAETLVEVVLQRDQKEREQGAKHLDDDGLCPRAEIELIKGVLHGGHPREPRPQALQLPKAIDVYSEAIPQLLFLRRNVAPPAPLDDPDSQEEPPHSDEHDDEPQAEDALLQAPPRHQQLHVVHVAGRILAVGQYRSPNTPQYVQHPVVPCCLLLPGAPLAPRPRGLVVGRLGCPRGPIELGRP